MTQLPPRTSSLPQNRDRLQPPDASTGLATGADISRPSSTAPKQTDTPKPGAEVLADKATIAFIRRTLCAQHALSGTGRATPRPIDELLPPLTSSNEVDLQLYAILAVILKEFVYTWYSKITPDHVFVDEVVQIIAHCTRALEQRLRKADLEAILLDEAPQLIDAHVKAFRAAHEPVFAQPLAHGPRDVYHTLIPHPALSPVPREALPSTLLDQARNEEAWRQLLVQGVLAVLLPTEDLENSSLRALVAEIFSEMIIGNGVSKKACEPWLLWDAITTIIEAVKPRTLKDVEKPTLAANRLEQFGLLNQQEVDEDQGRHGNRGQPGSAASRPVTGILWMFISYTILAFTAVRAVIYTIAASSSLPSRSKTWLLPAQSPTQADTLDASHATLSSDDHRPILSMSLWTTVGRIIDLDIRMPWLYGVLSLTHHVAMYGPGKVGVTDGVLDRWLSSKVHEVVLNPAHVTRVLKIVRATVFPNNAPGPPRRVPDAAEVVAIRRRCAVTIVSAVPNAVLSRYFNVDLSGDETAGEKIVDEVEEMLGVLGDVYMNRHLIFNLIELIVVRLIPEIGEKGVTELMRERVGEGGP